MPVITRAVERTLLAGVVMASVAVLGGQQSASADSYFKAVGRADGMRVVSGAGDALPLGASVEVGVPTAAVSLSSHSSHGFASAPYPGPVVQGALGLIASQGGPELAYPAVVESRHPGTPVSESTTGPYSLSTSSTATGSTADAKVENGQPGQSAASTIARATAKTVAGVASVMAMGQVQSLEVANVLKLGSVESQVEIVRHLDGRLARSSRLTIEGATVAGQSISVGPDGVTVGSQEIPLSETPLEAILADRGITISYLPSRKDQDSSMLGAGLRIDVVEDTPLGRLETAYMLGRSFVSLVSIDDATSSVRPDGQQTPAGSLGSTPGRVDPATSSGSDGSRPPVGRIDPLSPLSPPVTAEVAPSAPAAVPAVGEIALFGDLSSAFGYWYLALVAAGCATVVSGVTLRVLGVRQPSGGHR